MKVQDLAALLADPAVHDEAMGAIRSLISRIVLTPQDGEIRIDLEGELATSPICATTRKCPPSRGEASESK